MATQLTVDVNADISAFRTGISSAYAVETVSVADAPYDESMSQYLEVPTSGSTTVNMAGLTTVNVLSIVADEAVSVELNGGSGIVCKNLVITDTTITAIVLSCAGGDPANVRILAAGV